MIVYVMLHVEETSTGAVNTLYKGTHTRITEAVRYIKPETKVDFRKLSMASLSDKKYCIIPDGPNNYLLIFEDELKNVEVMETKPSIDHAHDDKKIVKVTEEEPIKGPIKPKDKMSITFE